MHPVRVLRVLRLASSLPSECKYISKDELAMLASTTGQVPAAAAATKKGPTADEGSGDAAPAAVLMHPAILALFGCHMAYNLTTLSINSWAPS